MKNEKWGLKNISGLSAKQSEKVKHDPHIHMIHVPSGMAGTVPESRTAEALTSGFEYAALMVHPKTGKKWVRHSEIKSAKARGFKHLHEVQ